MGHYYEKTSNGVEPRHFVGVSSRPGELRPTRITDARKAGWYPSVTTIQGLLDKPALTDWKITEHLKQAHKFYAACVEEAWPLMSLEEWTRRVKEDTQSALDKAPKDGTDFHDVLERYFSGGNIEDLSKEDRYTCAMVDEAVAHNCGKQEWVTEKSFVDPMGFAGKCDIHCSLPPGNGFKSGWVIDYKTKNTADKWKPGKMAYPEMAMQLAAYRVGLGLDNARCANVFICLETGEVEFYEWGEETLNRQWANFADLLRIWLRNAEYVPGSKPTGNNS